MLTPETIRRVQSLCVRSRRRVTDVFSGEYRSAVRGSGLEFEEFREYVPGDDVRRIDWNVSARMDRPFVKIHREERERTIYLLVDVSRSLKFGRTREKMAAAGEVAAVLAYVAGLNQDRVALITFTDRIESFIKPGKGPSHVWNIVSHLVAPLSKSPATDLGIALDFHSRLARRHSVCFVVSDFLACPPTDLKKTRQRHEYSFIRIFDPLENDFAIPALMDIRDLETGRVQGVVPSRSGQGSGVAWSTFLHELRLRGIKLWDLNCDQDYIGELIRHFRRDLVRTVGVK